MLNFALCAYYLLFKQAQQAQKQAQNKGCIFSKQVQNRHL